MAKMFAIPPTHLPISEEAGAPPPTPQPNLRARHGLLSIFPGTRTSSRYVLALFADAVEEKYQVEGLGKNRDLGFPKLTITEKDDSGGGDVSLDEWIGPSNATVGYVPQYDTKKDTQRFRLNIHGSLADATLHILQIHQATNRSPKEDDEVEFGRGSGPIPEIIPV